MAKKNDTIPTPAPKRPAEPTKLFTWRLTKAERTDLTKRATAGGHQTVAKYLRSVLWPSPHRVCQA